MAWTMLEPAQEYRACLCCPAKGQRLSMSAVLGVGFGMVNVTKDDGTVWSGDSEDVTLDRFEALAAQDPDHDWRVDFYGPMRRLVYQRHGIGEWILVSSGIGFA